MDTNFTREFEFKTGTVIGSNPQFVQGRFDGEEVGWDLHIFAGHKKSLHLIGVQNPKELDILIKALWACRNEMLIMSKTSGSESEALEKAQEETA